VCCKQAGRQLWNSAVCVGEENNELRMWSLGWTIKIVIINRAANKKVINCNNNECNKSKFQEQRIHSLITNNHDNIYEEFHRVNVKPGLFIEKALKIVRRLFNYTVSTT
jgi:hypothetical protein